MVWSFLLSNTRTVSDPFEAHFTVSDEAEISKKVRAAGENKWNNVKKEPFDSLKLVRAVPNASEGNVPLLPLMKDMTNVKVSDAYCILVDKESTKLYYSLRRN